MMQDRITENITHQYPPDILAQIPRSVCSTFDYYKAQKFIGEGKEAFLIALKKYEEKEHG